MEEKNFDIENIEHAVCNFFEVSVEDVHSRTKDRKISCARHFLWYILHEDFGMSNAQIAKRYGRIKRRVVEYISKIRFRVANQRGDAIIYKELRELV
jgi:chromosomal replication initiation ATPase DnaA